MKHLAVTKFSCTSEFFSSEIELDIPGEKIECLRAELASLLSKYGFEYQYGETHFLSTQKYSICNCSKCGHYMVDRAANPAGLDLSDDTQIIVFDGALLNGVPLCEVKGIGGQLHNKSLNTVRFAHWTRKSCAFARLLA